MDEAYFLSAITTSAFILPYDLLPARESCGCWALLLVLENQLHRQKCPSWTEEVKAVAAVPLDPGTMWPVYRRVVALNARSWLC